MLSLSFQVITWKTVIKQYGYNYLPKLPYRCVLSCRWILNCQRVNRRQRGPVDPICPITSSYQLSVKDAISPAIPSATLWRKHDFALLKMQITVTNPQTRKHRTTDHHKTAELQFLHLTSDNLIHIIYRQIKNIPVHQFYASNTNVKTAAYIFVASTNLPQTTRQKCFC